MGRPPGSVPGHRTLAEALAARIRAGEWPPGTVLPSQRQIARRFRSSPKTVRLALRELRRRHLASITPRGALVAGNPHSGLSARFNQVALVLAHSLKIHWSDPTWSQIHRGIEFAAASKWDPLLIVHGPEQLLRRQIPADLFELTLKGVLLAGPFQASVLRAYERLGRPVVLVDRPAEGRRLSSVCVENQGAACEAVLRLAALGHRRIAFFRRVSLGLREIDADSKERTAGFLRGCQQAGLGDARGGVYNFLGQPATDGPLMARLLRRTPRITAILSADLGILQLLLKAARGAGLAVPGELSLAAFAPAGSAVPYSGPRVDFFELGRQATLLLKKIQKGPLELRIPTVWHEGETVGPAPVGG